MDELVSLCKRRGFIYQSSDIYGGIQGLYDFGPLGVELKNNIKNAWWADMVTAHNERIQPKGAPRQFQMTGIESSIIMHPRVWKTSGHYDLFHDMMVDCRETKRRYRYDHIKGAWIEYDDQKVFISCITDGDAREEITKRALQYFKLKAKYLLGSNTNIKVTNKDDLSLIKKLLGHSIKIGNAFDIHKISKGKFLSLGGIKFKSKYSLIGHSDGDVVIHSIIDVLLGAIGKKDIGYYFPSSNKLYKNIDSVILLNEIYKRFNLKNVLILNLDITIITEAIRLEKYKNLIRQNVSKLLNCPISRVNIKAKSSDQIGIIGKSKGIACIASILIYK